MSNKNLDKKKIVIQDYVNSSGSSVYILIPKIVREKLGISQNSMYKLECNIEEKNIKITFG